MPLWKSTQIFEDDDFISGWTETWYINAADMTTAIIQGTQLAQARSAFLSAAHHIKWLRTTPNVPTLPPPVVRRKRKASLLRIDVQGNLPPGGEGDLPWTAVLARISDSSFQVSRLQLFRGVPDNFWDFNQDKLARARFNGWRAGMLAAFKQASTFILHRDDVGGLTPVAIDKMEFERMGKRNTGRPFGLLRGRR